MKHDCKPGCYCQGASTNNGKWWFAGDVAKGCTQKWQKLESEFSYQGMHLCPGEYPNSANGAQTLQECYYVNVAGKKVYNKPVRCAAGSYLPKESNDCATCPAGSYCQFEGVYYPSRTHEQGITGPMPDGTTGPEGATGPSQAIPNPPVECPKGQYADTANSCKDCPAGYYCPGWQAADKISPKIQCPDPNDPQYQMAPEDYPERYYANDPVSDGQSAVRLYGFTYTSWHTKLKDITECRIRLYGENQRGFFEDQGILYNKVTNKYDISGDLFYKSAKKKYYLTDRYMAGTQTYCEYHKDEANKWSMLYRQALLCELNKYCPGVKETRCAAGNFEESMGMKEPVEVVCARGQYLPADSENCALCPSGYVCEGDTFKTSHRAQGAKKTYTQAEMLYGIDATGKKAKTKPADPADACWAHFGPIGYKECVLGTSDIPTSGNDGVSGDSPRDGATAK